MQKKLWSKIKALLYKDVSRESESNDLSVLMRELAVVEMLWLLLLAVILAYLNISFLCLTSIFSVGVMAAVLILTYEDKTPAGMYLYIVANHILIALSCLQTEWKLYYTPMLLVCIMLFFFNARVRMKIKVYYAAGEAVFLAFLLFAEYSLPAHTAIPKNPMILIILLNMLGQVASVSLEAYSYSLKYTRNEEKIILYNKKLEDMVSRDALTGLWNRRAMNEHLSLLENGFRKHQKSFAVAIVDIDFFKKVNDTYGHGMGDFVLKDLSALLRERMEGIGSVARWGGEEFLLTFEEMQYEDAVERIDALRESISLHEFAFRDAVLHLTVTGGIEDYAMTDSVDAVISKADERLYAGKTGGRNRIVSSDETG